MPGRPSKVLRYIAANLSEVRAAVFVNASDMYLVVPAKFPSNLCRCEGQKDRIGGPGSTVATSALLFLEYSGGKG
jgi:hypothetical protein